MLAAGGLLSETTVLQHVLQRALLVVMIQDQLVRVNKPK